METIAKTRQKKRVNGYVCGLILVLISNLCFYTAESVVLYISLSSVGMLIIWFFYLTQKGFCTSLDKYVVWLTVLFLMFTIYGTLLLKKGLYNWDKMLFTYVQTLSLYICFKAILCIESWWKWLYRSFAISLIITFIYLVFKEGSLILLDTSRIGYSLSGDVNVVSDCIGILLLLVFYNYLKENNRLAAILTVLGLVFMLFTGSKRVVFVFIVMLAMAWPYAKRNLKVLIIIAIVFFAGIYFVFESDFFYNLIGHRFVDMYYQLLGRGSTAYYTSTNARLGMIIEGFHIFLSKPLFGGGMGYYSSQSATWGYYNYSHCNYVEMLCTFGLFGTLLYYIPFFRNMRELSKRRRKTDDVTVVLSMIVLMLAIDLVAVSFLEICIYYLPITLSFAILEKDE